MTRTLNPKSCTGQLLVGTLNCALALLSLGAQWIQRGVECTFCQMQRLQGFQRIRLLLQRQPALIHRLMRIGKHRRKGLLVGTQLRHVRKIRADRGNRARQIVRSMRHIFLRLQNRVDLHLRKTQRALGNIEKLVGAPAVRIQQSVSLIGRSASRFDQGARLLRVVEQRGDHRVRICSRQGAQFALGNANIAFDLVDAFANSAFTLISAGLFLTHHSELVVLLSEWPHRFFERLEDSQCGLSLRALVI